MRLISEEMKPNKAPIPSGLSAHIVMVGVSACAPAKRCRLAQQSTEEVRLSQNKGIDLKDRNLVRTKGLQYSP